MSHTYPRDRHRILHGFMEGDRIQLADTDLWITVERNLIEHGEELTIGAGRTLADGMGFQPKATRGDALDAVVTNAVILDPVLGVIKADIGIKDGLIAGIGQAGNPDVQSGVTLTVDTQTNVTLGAGMIATPGAIDTHVHFSNGALLDTFAKCGFTTLIGGTNGPGVLDLGVNPKRAFEQVLETLAGFPINLALLGRASSARGALEEQCEFGVSGFKIHEDLGAFPAVIDTTLSVADEYDVQTIIHTDTINEAVTLRETMDAINGRVIHAYHVEGAGGGHAPDILEIVGYPNVLPSSTTPTNPFSRSSVSEHLDMILTVHLGYPHLAEDLAFAQSRIRPSTMAAEDFLHELGAISMIGSDSNGMGRAAETIRRTWQLADKMKALSGATSKNDNERVLRYLAKYTACPAIAHGIDDYVGSLQPGRLADLVLWSPGFFGVKPQLVMKSGMVTYAQTGQANGSTVNCEPVRMRAWGAMGDVAVGLRRLFVSDAGLRAAKRTKARYVAQMLPVRRSRLVTKADLIRNNALPQVRVNTETFDVLVDGSPVATPPSSTVPMSRRYFLL